MGQALYRKYRPKNFAEVVGQEAIIKSLHNAIKSGRISHAYLFAGPRGVGKTSIARVLAHQVNGLPYSKDKSHLDIIEIDAASNRRIDEIRDLRDKVNITPVEAKYKVYIIDEVHMLTKEAFNALLKTLEEPPAHCIFILATTEAHKLPETIISRTQRFNFKPIAQSAARTKLDVIAKQEKIKIDKEALDLLAEYGEGSLRDIEGLLDQLSASRQQITEKEVRGLLGIPASQAIDELLHSIETGNIKTALSSLEKLKDQAASPVGIAKAFALQLRRQILEDNRSPEWAAPLLKELLEVSSSVHPYETLELAILGATIYSQSQIHDTPYTNKVNHNPDQEKRAKIRPKRHEAISSKKPAQFSLSQWAEVLNRLKNEAPSLYTALRLSEPSIIGDILRLDFPFALHQKKAQEARHTKQIAQAIEDICGARVVVKCTVNKDLAAQRDVHYTAESSATELKTISNIFGAAEVLES
jgi:DNA polymerase-3 subunit gamma/tau